MESTSYPEIQITVVIPALNEQEQIEAVIRATLDTFDRMRVSGEIVVVDDGGTDRTGTLVRNIMSGEPRVRLIRHDRPLGIGRSFWDGVEQARGELLCWLPGDFENHPEEILRYVGLMHDVDLVVPFVFNHGVRSAFRNLLSNLFRWIVNTTLRVKFNYTNGTVIYRRAVLMEVKPHSTGFLFTTEILVRLSRRGYLYAEVPYRLQPKSKTASKALAVCALWCVAREYFSLVWRIISQPENNSPFVEGSATVQRWHDHDSAVETATLSPARDQNPRTG